MGIGTVFAIGLPLIAGSLLQDKGFDLAGIFSSLLEKGAELIKSLSGNIDKESFSDRMFAHASQEAFDRNASPATDTEIDAMIEAYGKDRKFTDEQVQTAMKDETLRGIMGQALADTQAQFKEEGIDNLFSVKTQEFVDALSENVSANLQNTEYQDIGATITTGQNVDIPEGQSAEEAGVSVEQENMARDIMTEIVDKSVENKGMLPEEEIMGIIKEKSGLSDEEIGQMGPQIEQIKSILGQEMNNSYAHGFSLLPNPFSDEYKENQESFIEFAVSQANALGLTSALPGGEATKSLDEQTVGEATSEKSAGDTQTPEATEKNNEKSAQENEIELA